MLGEKCGAVKKETAGNVIFFWGLRLLGREAFVATIAERRIFGGFAKAEVESFFLGDFKFKGLQASAFVGAIAERLIGTAATGTPPMGACFDFECQGLSAARNCFFGHAATLAVSA